MKDEQTAAPKNNPNAPVVSREDLRPEVLAFAHLMERQLRANDHKPGWKGHAPHDLAVRMFQEATEATWAIADWKDGTGDTQSVGTEAADVANFAMMIADVCGALAALAPAHPGSGRGLRGLSIRASGKRGTMTRPAAITTRPM